MGRLVDTVAVVSGGARGICLATGRPGDPVYNAAVAMPGNPYSCDVELGVR